MAIPQDFMYTQDDMQERVNRYFDKCDEEHQKYSDAGLCDALDLSQSRFRIISKMGDEYLALSPGERVKYRDEHKGENIQYGHIEMLKKAVLRITAQLAGRTDSMAIFLAKQPELGGYTDRPASDGANIGVTIKLEGAGKGDAFG